MSLFIYRHSKWWRSNSAENVTCPTFMSRIFFSFSTAGAGGAGDGVFECMFFPSPFVIVVVFFSFFHESIFNLSQTTKKGYGTWGMHPFGTLNRFVAFSLIWYLLLLLRFIVDDDLNELQRFIVVIVAICVLLFCFFFFFYFYFASLNVGLCMSLSYKFWCKFETKNTNSTLCIVYINLFLPQFFFLRFFIHSTLSVFFSSV